MVWMHLVEQSKSVSTSNMSMFVLTTGMTRKPMLSAELWVHVTKLHIMVFHYIEQTFILIHLLCDQIFMQFCSLWPIVNRASTIEIPGGTQIYHYSMCNGTEHSFHDCQLSSPDFNSSCPSIGMVNCTEGVNNNNNIIVIVFHDGCVYHSSILCSYNQVLYWWTVQINKHF